MNMEAFPLHTVSIKSILFLVLIGFLPGIIVLITFSAAKIRSTPIGFVVLAVSAIAIGAILLQQHLAKVVVADGRLVVGGGLYSVTVESNAIRRDDVAPVPSNSLTLGYRSNGVGLPGFSLGWFQPPHGKKLFVLVTDEAPVFVPTNLDYDVVVSAADPDALAAVIRRM